MDYKTGRRSDCQKKSGGIRYHYTHIYTDSCTSGDSNRRYQEEVHVNTASKEEKERFKKEQERYYWIISPPAAAEAGRIHGSIYG